jgi:hypothetical protein
LCAQVLSVQYFFTMAVILYAARWWQLAMFSLLTFINGFQWIAFAAKSDTFQAFFGASSALSINVLSAVYMIAYPVVLIPALWLTQSTEGQVEGSAKEARKWTWWHAMGSLRRTVTISAILNACGATVKWLAVTGLVPHSDSYSLTVVGQCLAAIAQVFILGSSTYSISVRGCNDLSQVRLRIWRITGSGWRSEVWLVLLPLHSIAWALPYRTCIRFPLPPLRMSNSRFLSSNAVDEKRPY